MLTAKPYKVSAIHPTSAIAIILTNYIFSSGATCHIRYVKSNIATIVIVPPTMKIDFLFVAFFDCLLIADMTLIKRKLNKNELGIFY